MINPKQEHFVGYTIDGKITVKNLGKLYYQYGLPLCFVFDRIIQFNWMPSWIHLYEELKENGMTHKRIIHLLHEHIVDSYGKEVRDHVVKKLELYAK